MPTLLPTRVPQSALLRRLTGADVARIIKKLVTRAGFDATKFAGYAVLQRTRREHDQRSGQGRPIVAGDLGDAGGRRSGDGAGKHHLPADQNCSPDLGALPAAWTCLREKPVAPAPTTNFT